MQSCISICLERIKGSEITVSLVLNTGIRWGGVSGQLHVPAALARVQVISAPTGKPAGWAPEPVWILNRREKYLGLDGNQIMPSPAST